MSLLSATLQDGRSSIEAQKKVQELKDHFSIGMDEMSYCDSLDEELTASLNSRERDSLDIQHAVLKARVVDGDGAIFRLVRLVRSPMILVVAKKDVNLNFQYRPVLPY